MAACCRQMHTCASLSAFLRRVQLQHVRLVSTTTSCSEAEKPRKFIPPSKPVIIDKTQATAAQRKFLSPEFVPPRQRTDPLKFSMERKDMIRRRKVLDIPEFYAGSIVAVTTSDSDANGKNKRFVGICIHRGGSGLGATFILRNIIDNQGVEVCFELYSPLIQTLEVLKLERRLDQSLLYLRDALPDYSTVDPDMRPVPAPPTGDPPLNKLKVRMRPKPWSKRWERPKYGVAGIAFEQILSPEKLEHAQKWAQPWLEYDMLREYDTSHIQQEILQELREESGQQEILQELREESGQ
ncbi:unnamed protein product [Knipowitschia caucasica]